MCGITGFFDPLCAVKKPEVIAGRMAECIAHRGPDDSGVWLDESAGIALAQRRLSILDLSPAGHQPMISPSKRYTLVYNGEIYNHKLLRILLAQEELQPVNWNGNSDTETLLGCIDAWGVEETLKKTVGMFAFALWDCKERSLCLARDRMGEKPLYYGWQNGVFLFGSELKALKVHPSFVGEIDRDSLTLFLRHSYIPTPYTIYKGISKLPSGSYLKLPAWKRQHSVGEMPEPIQYWSFRHVAEDSLLNSYQGDEIRAVKDLDSLLLDSVGQQMVADVQLGAFLSGGIDSSTIVALMQAQSDSPVKSFTIGFNEKDYNEAEYAKAVARHLGTEHTELYVSPVEAMEVIPRLPLLYDEPFSDASQIPTFLVSQMTRQHVTVSLSGDGGDELFGGYNRYLSAVALQKKCEWLPYPLRKNLTRLLRVAPVSLWETLGKLGHISQAPDKIAKVLDIFSSSDQEAVYRCLISHWKRPVDVVLGATEPPTVLTDRGQIPSLADFEHRMMYLDTMTYLPDDVLVKIDRAAMAVSLETRVPFLDHRVVEFAWRLPLAMKIRNGQGKWILRQVLKKYVPDELIDRPKVGFGVPLDSWLRGPLRDWAENLLAESRLRQEGFFETQAIRRKWDEHLSGKCNWQYHLWDVLMFQAWLEKS